MRRQLGKLVVFVDGPLFPLSSSKKKKKKKKKRKKPREAVTSMSPWSPLIEGFDVPTN